MVEAEAIAIGIAIGSVTGLTLGNILLFIDTKRALERIRKFKDEIERNSKG